MFENKFLRYQAFSEVSSAILDIKNGFKSNDDSEHYYVVTPKNATVEECESSMDLGANGKDSHQDFLNGLL